MTTDWIVAIDLGGTRLRAALCSPDGVIHQRIGRKTRAKRGTAAVLARITGAVEQVWPTSGQVRALSLSAPGPLDPFQGIVLESPNLPGWERVPLRDIMASRFDIPVLVGNDANLAALGEHRFGAGIGCDDLIYLTISTGIGGGVILGGKLFLGSRGLAGEIGHMVLQPGGPQCGCGNQGCLEALASGTAIGRQARTLAASGRAPAILAAAGGDVSQVTSRSVGEAAAQGDSTAQDLIVQAGRHIGIGIANLMHLFNPQRFVVGGGVTNAGELLFRPMRETAPRWVQIPQYSDGVAIVPASLGDDVSLLGAVALACSEVGIA